jgi:hypothetical protein
MNIQIYDHVSKRLPFKQKDTYCVEELKVPVVWKILPGNWVRVVTKHQTSLDCKVHDHKSLSAKLVWKNFERVSNQKARPSKSIEDAEHPDPNDLRVTS